LSFDCVNDGKNVEGGVLKSWNVSFVTIIM
jgi:hypothetical protein